MKEAVIKSVTRILDNYLEVTRHRKTPERYTILRAIYSHKGLFTLDELQTQMVETTVIRSALSVGRSRRLPPR